MLAVGTWLLTDNIDLLIRIIVVIVIFLIPIIYALFRTIRDYLKQIASLKDENKKLEISNSKWKKNFQQAEYDNILLAEYKATMTIAIYLSSASTKAKQLEILQHVHENKVLEIERRKLNVSIDDEGDKIETDN